MSALLPLAVGFIAGCATVGLVLLCAGVLAVARGGLMDSGE